MAGIYAAGSDDSRWPAVLSQLQTAFSGSAAALMSLPSEPARQRIISTYPAAAADYLQYWNARNPLRPPRVVLNAGDVVTDRMMVPREQLVRTEYFNEFLLPTELPHLLAVKLVRTGSSDITLNVMRASRPEGFSPRDLGVARRLAVHLLNAIRLAAHLPERGLGPRGSIDVLEHLTAGTALVGHDGKVLHVNAAAAAMLARRDGLELQGSRLRAMRATEDAALTRLIGLAAIGDDAGQRGGALAVARPSGARPWGLIVAPLTIETPILAPYRPTAVVSIADPERTPLPPAARLAALFGLTERESAVALGIAAGQELKDVAAALGLTTLTARQYLSRALQKTEASRQHDLARILVALGMAPN